MQRETQQQQPQLVRTRAVLASAKRVALLVDAPDLVERLSCSLPVVIDGADWEAAAEEVDDLFLGDAEVWRRPAVGTANPLGGENPYVSPEGHSIVDVRFYEGYRLYGEAAEYSAIADEVSDIPGVVAHGLLVPGSNWFAVVAPHPTSGSSSASQPGSQQPRVIDLATGKDLPLTQ